MPFVLVELRFGGAGSLPRAASSPFSATDRLRDLFFVPVFRYNRSRFMSQPTQPPFSWEEILRRWEPTFKAVFAAYEISERDARQVLEEALEDLLRKKTAWLDPEGWLLRTVVERCRTIARGGDR